MLAHIKKVAGETMIYGLSSVISSLLSIILIPIYTRIFLPADYGIINLLNVTFNLLYIVVVFGLDNSAALWYWKYEGEEDRSKTFTTWAFFQLALGLLISLILIFLSSFFSDKILGSTTYKPVLIVAAMNFPLWSFQKVMNMWYRLRHNPWKAVSFAIFITASTLILSVLFVVRFKFGVIGVFYAQLCSSFLGFIFAVFTLKGIFKIHRFDTARLKQMISFSFPLVPATICMWILTSAGLYFVKYMRDITDVGLFQIGINIASLVNIVISAFLQAWPPFALSIHKNEDHKQVYSYIFSLYGALGSTIVCGVFIFAHEILRLFTSPQYYNAYWVAGIFSVNMLIAGVAQITSIGCNLKGTNVPYGVSVIVGSAIALLLFIILIPVLGKEGAAISTLCSNIFIASYTSKRAQRLYPIPYDFKTFVFMITLVIILSSLSNYITSMLNAGPSLVVKCSFFLSYVLIVGGYFFYIKKIGFTRRLDQFKSALAHNHH